MSRWPVRRLVGLYPRAWRERYGREVGDLTDELISEGRTTRLRAGLELAEGAALKHVRAPTRSPAAGLGCVAAITAAAGIGLAVVRAGATRSRAPGFWVASAACVIAWETWLYLAPAIVPAAAIRPGALAFSGGLVVFLAGIGLRGWSFAALGRYSTYGIVVSPAQPVVATGPYRWLRHPSYTGGLLICSGAGLMSANWAGVAAMTLLPLAVTVWQIHTEEHALLTGLGERYRAYACDRKRLVPLIW